MESIYVADGTQVAEIGLPVESPVPTLEALRDRLASGDVEGALALVVPSQRSAYRSLYQEIELDLAVDAAAMKGFAIDILRTDRAVVDILTEDLVDGVLTRRAYPAHLVRGEDGEWRIFGY